MNRSWRVARWMAGLCAAAMSFSAFGDGFPTRPITLVSPYQAGGAADSIARAVADAAARDLGQPVVVEAKPGAEGLLGAFDVQKAPPDGYRVLWGGAGSLMVATALRKTPPFDPATAFTPVAASVDFSFFLYVNPDLPVKTVQEFIAYVKAHPGKVAYATGNNQGLLSMEDLALKYDLKMVRVQYKGEIAAATDLVANRVQAIFSTPSLQSFVKDGKLRVIATTLNRRSPLFPDAPTLKELGIDAAVFGGGWLGIYGPAGMDKAIVARLNKAFVKSFTDPEVQKTMLTVGLVYTPYTTPDALVKYTRDQRDLYRKTIRELKVPLAD